MSDNANKKAVFYACAAFVSSFAAAYAATIAFNIPLPIYFPLTDEWAMAPVKGVPSQRWYAMFGFALAVSLPAAAAAWLTTKNSVRENFSSGEKTAALAMWAVLAALSSYAIYHEAVKWNIFGQR